MGLSAEELEEHCQKILGDRRIKNKVVVLCEGEIAKDSSGRRSPQAYKKMEQMPDANFYRKCVPKSWNDKPKPQFFNCGDRKDVVDTYLRLLELGDTSQSYLNKAKLFALVDLDIQLHKITNYQYSDTEQIFNHLYNKTQIVEQNAAEHFIWVTGLIHKEAYFISPELQQLYNDYLLQPQYNNAPVLLSDLYLSICQDTPEDLDLKNNFDRAIKRISHCQQLDCYNLEELKDIWHKEYVKANNRKRKQELAFLLLTIIKAKHYWHQIKPPSDYPSKAERFREQLSLEIGKFYAKQDWCNSRHHIPYFFYTLYQFA